MAVVGIGVVFAMAVGLWSLWTLAATGVPVVASLPDVRNAALDALQVGPATRFADLGCGFGGVLTMARARGAVVYGYELNLAVWFVTWIRNVADWQVRVRLRDSRKANLKRFDAVYAYLMPHAMKQLARPLATRLPAGARVASVSFPIPDWTPERVLEVGLRREPVYVYRIGSHQAPSQGSETPKD